VIEPGRFAGCHSLATITQELTAYYSKSPKEIKIFLLAYMDAGV